MLAHVAAKCTLHAKRVRSVDELRQNGLESKWKSSRLLPENRNQCGGHSHSTAYGGVTAQPTVVQQLQSWDFSAVFLINVNCPNKALSQHKRRFENISKNKVKDIKKSKNIYNTRKEIVEKENRFANSNNKNGNPSCSLLTKVKP